MLQEKITAQSFGLEGYRRGMGQSELTREAQLRAVEMGLRRILGDDAQAKWKLPDLVVHLEVKVERLKDELAEVKWVLKGLE